MVRNAALPAWQAEWIDPELPHDAEARQPASCLRRSFSVDHAGKARLYITCHGLYAAFLNGKRVGSFVLAPGTGDYRQRLTVQCYDVTDLLRAAVNFSNLSSIRPFSCVYSFGAGKNPRFPSLVFMGPEGSRKNKGGKYP